MITLVEKLQLMPIKFNIFDNILGELYDEGSELKTDEQLEEFFKGLHNLDYFMTNIQRAYSEVPSKKYFTSNIQKLMDNYKSYIANILTYYIIYKN